MDTSVSPMRIATNVGAVVAILMLCASLFGWQKIGWFIFVIGIYSGMKRYRKEIGGCIGYFRALQAGFQTSFFASLILAFVAYVSATFDPASLETALEMIEQRIITSGLQSELIMPQMRENLTPTMFAASAVFAYCAIGGLVSIVGAFFVKKHLILLNADS